MHHKEHASDVLLSLQANGFPATLSLVPPEHPSSRAMDAALLALAGHGDGSVPGSSPDDLAADYAAIYLTYALRASPCESVWLDEDHLVMQGPTFAVREFYKRHGYEADGAVFEEAGMPHLEMKKSPV